MPRTPGAPEHVVSPTLLDSIDQYVEQLDAGTAISGDVVPETSPVISFMENAFAQFHFKYVVRLLERISALAKKKSDDELQEHTERSLVAFLAAIEAYDWNSDESDG